MNRFISKKGAVALSLVAIPPLVYVFYGHHLTLNSLKANRDMLTNYARDNFVQASVIFILVMLADIALTIPGATTLSFAGGLLFPQPYAALYAYFGYVLGACMSYFLVKTVLADYVRPMLRPDSAMFKRLEAKLKKNAFIYLILARYTLIFPYWFVTAAASIVGVPFSVFAPATSIAVIPGAIIYTSGGVALGAILDTLGTEHSVDLTTGELIWKALTSSDDIKYLGVGLAIAGIVPLVLKRIAATPKQHQN
jgi:uncharacterized membrane protein YdjX (TVP38/TMEM64 family)